MFRCCALLVSSVFFHCSLGTDGFRRGRYVAMAFVDMQNCKRYFRGSNNGNDWGDRFHPENLSAIGLRFVNVSFQNHISTKKFRSVCLPCHGVHFFAVWDRCQLQPPMKRKKIWGRKWNCVMWMLHYMACSVFQPSLLQMHFWRISISI